MSAFNLKEIASKISQANAGILINNKDASLSKGSGKVSLRIDKEWAQAVKSVRINESFGSSVDDNAVLTIVGHEQVDLYEPVTITINGIDRFFFVITSRLSVSGADKTTTVTLGTQFFKYKAYINKLKPFKANATHQSIIEEINSRLGVDAEIWTDGKIIDQAQLDNKTQAASWLVRLGQVGSKRKIQMYYLWFNSFNEVHFETKATTDDPVKFTLDAIKDNVASVTLSSSTVDRFDAVEYANNPDQKNSTPESNKTTEGQWRVGHDKQERVSKPGATQVKPRVVVHNSKSQSATLPVQHKEKVLSGTIAITGYFSVRANDVIELINSQDLSGKLTVARVSWDFSDGSVTTSISVEAEKPKDLSLLRALKVKDRKKALKKKQDKRKTQIIRHTEKK